MVCEYIYKSFEASTDSMADSQNPGKAYQIKVELCSFLYQKIRVLTLLSFNLLKSSHNQCYHENIYGKNILNLYF